MSRRPELSLEELRSLDRQVFWHPFSQMADYDGLIIRSAEGCWLETVDGRRFLDGTSALWCNLHGHRHPQLDRAVIEQLSQVAHVTALGMSHPTTLRLAQRLTSLAPEGLNHVFFSGDGASAVEVAMKMAFQYWRQKPSPELGRDRFLALGEAYHGDTLGTSSLGGVSRYRELFEPLLFPVLRGPCPAAKSDGDNQHLTREYLAAYEQLLQSQGERIVAIVVEPLVQAAAGIVMHPPGFLKGLAELAERYGTLLIADEVAVGFGRTGSLFACEQEQVSPDLMCLGKGLTGGYLPLSATLCSTRIWDTFLGNHPQPRTFFYGHTYTGNPLAAAAANASLDLFETEQTLANLPLKARRLADGLQSLKNSPYVSEVRQRGLIAAVDLVADTATHRPFPAGHRQGVEFCRRLLDHQVWLRPLGDTIPMIPPLSISLNELDHLVAAMAHVLESLGRERMSK
jgi:adenosylmethionine-8-amino-7-oxononanoate aminotransferase